MTKEDLLFRLETFKGQLETFETALRRSVTTGTVDKETLEKEIMKLNRNYLPMREYISHFVGGHHFTIGLGGHAVSEARLNSIGFCIRDVSITSAQIARMNRRQFAGFMKKIEYSMSRRQEEAKEKKKAVINGRKQGAIYRREEQHKEPNDKSEGAVSALDETVDLSVIQSQIKSQTTRVVTEELRKGKRLIVFLIILAVGFGLFGTLFSIYFALRQADSLNSIKENMVQINKQNTRIISEIMTSIENQTGLMNSMKEDMEKTSKRDDERLGDMVTSLTDLRQNFRGIGESELGGSIYVPLKLGTTSAVLEIDPFNKRALIKGKDYRTGKEIIKVLDPATTNLIIWELNELKYGAE
jgi:hypothetical protein